MNNLPVIIERTLNASVEKVWRAISDKNEMKKWYFDLAEFKPEPGFEFNFTGGPEDGIQYLHLCKITEAIPNKKLSYSWRYEGYDGNSLVTFELFPEGEKTRLRLTHSGLDTFPKNNPDFAKENFTQGWKQIVGESLVNYIDSGK
jgi:uncharacterized protein YndB with AHSA1/START domain